MYSVRTAGVSAAGANCRMVKMAEWLAFIYNALWLEYVVLVLEYVVLVLLVLAYQIGHQT